MHRALVYMAPVLFATALAAGCSTGITLTSAGSGVTQVSAADTPIGCNLLGDVAIGIPPDAARPRTQEELVILMRNKAGDTGGNYVVVESMDERRPENEERSHWVGRGVAYACREGAADPHSVPSDDDRGGTAGGEDGAGDEAGEDALDGI